MLSKKMDVAEIFFLSVWYPWVRLIKQVSVLNNDYSNTHCPPEGRSNPMMLTKELNQPFVKAGAYAVRTDHGDAKGLCRRQSSQDFPSKAAHLRPIERDQDGRSLTPWQKLISRFGAAWAAVPSLCKGFRPDR